MLVLLLQCNIAATHPVRFSETSVGQLWYNQELRKEIGFYMQNIPETGFMRLPQVLSVIPVGKTSWWEGVKSGRFPKPVKLSARCTAWRAEDIRALITRLSEGDGPVHSS